MENVQFFPLFSDLNNFLSGMNFESAAAVAVRRMVIRDVVGCNSQYSSEIDKYSPIVVPNSLKGFTQENYLDKGQ